MPLPSKFGSQVNIEASVRFAALIFLTALLVSCAEVEPVGVTKVIAERDLEAGEPPKLPMDYQQARPMPEPRGLLRWQRRF